MHTTRIAVFVVAPVLMLGAFVLHLHNTRGQRTLDRVASEIAGRRVSVRCPNRVSAVIDRSPEDGMVLFSADRPAD